MEGEAMMGERMVMQEALFYEFSLERHVPDGHLVRAVDRFVDLAGIRAHLRPFYSENGRPSIDPELMIRMLLVGYCFNADFFNDIRQKRPFKLRRPSCRASRDAVTTLAEVSSDLIIGLGANSRDWMIAYLGQLAAALPMPAPEEIC
jgi:hypothetical protein